MDKYFLIEIQRFVDEGGQLSHEEGVKLFNEFINEGGRLSHDEVVVILHALGRTLKNRRPRRLSIVAKE